METRLIENFELNLRNKVKFCLNNSFKKAVNINFDSTMAVERKIFEQVNN